MKVLLVGGGGREHALAWKFKRSIPSGELLAAPGNPGIAELARCVALAADDIHGLADLAEEERVALTVVGPEAPLAAGIVDHFRGRGLPIFGPTRAAARIETSKIFAKRLMLDAGVPTARAERHADALTARRAARSFGAPLVIKASGLASGKGVIVCETMADADEAIDAMLLGRAFGDAGSEILVEEFMRGEELSLFALTDGERVLSMLPAQDHKRLCEADTGPNTGGMGAYAPVSIADAALVRRATDDILLPTLAAMRKAGSTFSGLLYAGLMVTPEGPKVVEFNCRFGDPETQTLLPMLRSSILEPMLGIASGQGLAGIAPLEWRPGASVTTVLAAEGYPAAARSGDRVSLPPAEGDVHVFHAGTARDPSGELVTAGGRVLAVTAVADTLAEAHRRSVQHAAAIEFEGKQYRRDIGWRELRRHARAS